VPRALGPRENKREPIPIGTHMLMNYTINQRAAAQRNNPTQDLPKNAKTRKDEAAPTPTKRP